MVKAHVRSGLTEKQETAGRTLALQNHRPTCCASTSESRAFIELGRVDITAGFFEQRLLDGAEDVGRLPPAGATGWGRTRPACQGSTSVFADVLFVGEADAFGTLNIGRVREDDFVAFFEPVQDLDGVR